MTEGSIPLGKWTLLAMFLLAVPLPARAQVSPVQIPRCGFRPDQLVTTPAASRGGKYLTAAGSVRALIVFVSFPDDNNPHPYWPAHSPPLFLNDFIDPDTTTRSTAAFNLTNYFRQMSLGQFQLFGEAIWVETGHYQTEYLNGSYYRANWSVLQEKVDPVVDFTRYDNWTNLGPYLNINEPDSVVDMIVMVWRTTIFEFIGEASLGYRTGFVADGKRVEMGYPERFDWPLGSGVTCEYPYGDDPVKVMKTMAHEVAHWLLGGPHPYNSGTLNGKHQFWSVLCSGERVSACANAYERERLGWITVPELLPGSDVVLTDFVTTGAAAKYRPPSGDVSEYFYIENHQRISAFDDVTLNPDDRGIWILHQQGEYVEQDNLRICPSDGNWTWASDTTTSQCFGAELPVFSRGAPAVLSGNSHRDQLITSTSAVNWMHTYKDLLGDVLCGAFFAGEMFKGAFDTSDAVFSPCSNPASNAWTGAPSPLSVEVTTETGGVIAVRLHGGLLDGRPARRYLSRDPGQQQIPAGWRALAWGNQWPEGQLIEADVQWSELERRVGDGGGWERVYDGPMTGWSDGSMWYDSTGVLGVWFRVRVRDTQGKVSAWSNLWYERASYASAVDESPAVGTRVPRVYRLGTWYPNPFNSSSRIEFDLPEECAIRMSIYDLLGREVRELMTGVVSAGRHTASWDGRGRLGQELPTGIYVTRLRTLPADKPVVGAVQRVLLLR